MAPPGIVLSQPTSTTSASNMCPRATSSIESAITSRETSEVFMPSVPMVMPSLIAMVLNSIGVPPASRTPRFTCSASRRRLKLHGMVSVQVLAMPTSGRARAAAPKRIVFKYALAEDDRARHVDAAEAEPTVGNAAAHRPTVGQAEAHRAARLETESVPHRPWQYGEHGPAVDQELHLPGRPVFAPHLHLGVDET